MNCLNFFTVLGLVAFVTALPTDNESKQMRFPCNIQDPIACLKMTAWNFFNSIFNKDNFKLPNLMEVKPNKYYNNQLRSHGDSLEDKIENYIKTHNVNIKLPMVDSTIEMEARNLDSNEIDFKVQLSNSSEGRKSKFKKIAAPIIIFVLLKAIIFIPLALGIVGLKAWNAMQLSFVSFVATIGLAVYQLCKKISDDTAPPIAAHVAWDPYRQKRSVDIAQEIAYNAYR